METKLDMRSIQLMNLFWSITQVRALDCFEYGANLIFVVRPAMFAKALSGGGEKIRYINEKLNKKIRVVKLPSGLLDSSLEKFIAAIVYPIKLKGIANDNGVLAIKAGQQSKAKLIGRDHARLNELRNILRKYFKIKQVRVA